MVEVASAGSNVRRSALTLDETRKRDRNPFLKRVSILTINDVAAEAGVSVATVSRVLNNAGYPVRAETRERVLAAIEKLDFRPNELARGLLLKSTRTVGLAIPDIANPYYPLISRGVEDVASEHGYAVIICNTDRDARKSERYINTLLQKQVDGMILAGGGTDFTTASERFAKRGTRVVFIGRPGPAWPSVRVPNADAAAAAMEHLADLGHRRVGFIGGASQLTSAVDRLDGYLRAVAEHGLDDGDALRQAGDFTEESGYRAAAQLLSLSPPPTAIFAANDRMAIGAMAAAHDAGRAVPGDLSVVGFDDIPMASYLRPPLTTVALPGYEMGAAAMRLLLEQVQAGPDGDAPEPPVVHLDARLVVRESTAPPSHTTSHPASHTREETPHGRKRSS
jgi:LacI family transcriptional regulator